MHAKNKARAERRGLRHPKQRRLQSRLYAIGTSPTACTGRPSLIAGRHVHCCTTYLRAALSRTRSPLLSSTSPCSARPSDRKSVGWRERVPIVVDIGVGRSNKKKQK